MTLESARRAALVLALLGLVGTALATLLAPSDFPHAWLAAFVTWLGWPLGSMGLLLIHALTGGSWGEITRQQLRAGTATLVLLIPALMPIVLVVSRLYPWLRPEVAEHLGNGFYLNGFFLAIRTAIYLGCWLSLAWLVLRALERGEGSLARLAPSGLIVLAITSTFATIDATMSLDPGFASSVYGLIGIAHMGLLALSVTILAVALHTRPRRPPLDDLGQLLMALLILWAYLDFVQLLIVWQSDLPSEAAWYLPRTTGGWGIAAGLVVLGHFFLPFFAMLSPRVRRSPGGIAAICTLLIVSSVIWDWWLVLPAAARSVAPLDVFAMVAMAGFSAALALWVPELSDQAGMRTNV